MSYKALPARFSHDGLKMGIEARDLPVESAVVKEEYAQDLGEREDHLPVRQPQQQPLVHVREPRGERRSGAGCGVA